jgi:tRNA-dihydrouridine synthase B
MKIGNLEINGKVFLAPMAGVNCTSFRIMCRKHGACFLFTQMYDTAMIIEKEKDGSLDAFLNIKDEERPIALQLIGNAKANWKKAVNIAKSYADIIDINIGCAEREYLDKKAGSYLMDYPKEVYKIVKACVSSTDKPVTAKIRSGYSRINAIEISKELEKAGAAAITVHPRTAKEHYAGKA